MIHTNSLGATLQQVGGGKSSRSGTDSAPARTLSEAKAGDEWGHFIVPFSSGYGIILTDGVSNWNVIMSGNETVEDALDSILTKYYKYSLLPQQNENGTYTSISHTKRGHTTLRGWLTDAMGITDSKGDAEFDAAYDRDNYRINADSADYNTAASQGLLRTLNEVLASNNVLSRTFYVPYGYYYIGKDVNTSPYYGADAATTAKQQGDTYKENQTVQDAIDWMSNNPDSPPTPQKTQMSKTKKTLYGLITVATILYFMIPSNNNK